VFQIIGRITAPLRNAIGCKVGLPEESRLRKVIQVCITFILVCFAWVFFRANTIADAFFILKRLAELPAELIGYARGLSQTGIIVTVRNAFQIGKITANPIKDFGLSHLGFAWIFIAVLIINDVLMRKTPGETILKQKPLVLRWALYYALLIAIMFNWSAGISQFIYFTF